MNQVYLRSLREHHDQVMQKWIFRIKRRQERRERFISFYSGRDKRASTQIRLIQEFEKREKMRERQEERRARRRKEEHQKFVERERIKTRNYGIGAKKRAYNKLKVQFIEDINFPE